MFVWAIVQPINAVLEANIAEAGEISGVEEFPEPRASI